MTVKKRQHIFPQNADSFCAHCPHCEAQQKSDPVKRALRALDLSRRMLNNLARQSYQVAEQSEVESTQIVGSNTNVALSDILDEIAIVKIQLDRISVKGVKP